MLEIKTRPPRFPMHCAPRGCLPDLLSAHACWYYYLIAQKAFEDAGKSIEDQNALGLLEGNVWRTPTYVQQKRSVGLIYNVSPDTIDRHWDAVEREIRRWNALHENEAHHLPMPNPVYVKACP